MPNEYRLNTLKMYSSRHPHLTFETRRETKLRRRIWFATTYWDLIPPPPGNIAWFGEEERGEITRAAFRTRRIDQPRGFRTKLAPFQGLVIIEWASAVSPWDFETVVLECTKRGRSLKSSTGERARIVRSRVRKKRPSRWTSCWCRARQRGGN